MFPLPPSPAGRVTGIHHLAYEVNDIKAAIARLMAEGARMIVRLAMFMVDQIGRRWRVGIEI